VIIGIHTAASRRDVAPLYVGTTCHGRVYIGFQTRAVQRTLRGTIILEPYIEAIASLYAPFGLIKSNRRGCDRTVLLALIQAELGACENSRRNNLQSDAKSQDIGKVA